MSFLGLSSVFQVDKQILSGSSMICIGESGVLALMTIDNKAFASGQVLISKLSSLLSLTLI